VHAARELFVSGQCENGISPKRLGRRISLSGVRRRSIVVSFSFCSLSSVFMAYGPNAGAQAVVFEDLGRYQGHALMIQIPTKPATSNPAMK
jgi:hypothetical protein